MNEKQKQSTLWLIQFLWPLMIHGNNNPVTHSLMRIWWANAVCRWDDKSIRFHTCCRRSSCRCTCHHCCHCCHHCRCSLQTSSSSQVCKERKIYIRPISLGPPANSDEYYDTIIVYSLSLGLLIMTTISDAYCLFVVR